MNLSLKFPSGVCVIKVKLTCYKQTCLNCFKNVSIGKLRSVNFSKFGLISDFLYSKVYSFQIIERLILTFSQAFLLASDFFPKLDLAPLNLKKKTMVRHY